MKSLAEKGPQSGDSMMELIERLFPICRSITGAGVRDTLDVLGEVLSLQRYRLPTGQAVLDWRVPKEWTVEAATLKDPEGHSVVDFKDHNLHLLNYSAPFEGSVALEELEEHLYSLPEHPEWVPYRTSYYQERWGFCLSHHDRQQLVPGQYEVAIDTALGNGHLDWGELYLPPTVDASQASQDVLLSAHICHPSLANDNLSAIAVLWRLGQLLGELEERRHGYRLVFAPGTIGAICWLAHNRDSAAKRVGHGLVLANLGDRGRFHYKRTRRGQRGIDRAVARTFEADLAEGDFELRDFSPFGYDERQYGSPGFDLPVGLLSRTPWGEFPEYHTSADDLSLVSSEALAESLDVLLAIVAAIESGEFEDGPLRTKEPRDDGTPVLRNVEPYGEPQLGSRGLYSTLGGGENGREQQLAILWLLNQCDGENSLGEISERSGFTVERLSETARILTSSGLLERLRG